MVIYYILFTLSYLKLWSHHAAWSTPGSGKVNHYQFAPSFGEGAVKGSLQQNRKQESNVVFLEERIEDFEKVIRGGGHFENVRLLGGGGGVQISPNTCARMQHSREPKREGKVV